jgi:hypothetical protein
MTKPEPIGWIVMQEGLNLDELTIHEVEQIGYDEKPMPNQFRVYTEPPQREWVGLTDLEIYAVENEYLVNSRIPVGCGLYFAKDIEAKLKEKNGG